MSVTVTLDKSNDKKLGFTIVPSATGKGFAIKAVVAGGQAEATGMMSAGQVITHVNGTDMTGMTMKENLSIIRSSDHITLTMVSKEDAQKIAAEEKKVAIQAATNAPAGWTLDYSGKESKIVYKHSATGIVVDSIAAIAEAGPKIADATRAKAIAKLKSIENPAVQMELDALLQTLVQKQFADPNVADADDDPDFVQAKGIAEAEGKRLGEVGQAAEDKYKATRGWGLVEAIKSESVSNIVPLVDSWKAAADTVNADYGWHEPFMQEKLVAQAIKLKALSSKKAIVRKMDKFLQVKAGDSADIRIRKVNTAIDQVGNTTMCAPWRLAGNNDGENSTATRACMPIVQGETVDTTTCTVDNGRYETNAVPAGGNYRRDQDWVCTLHWLTQYPVFKNIY